MYNTCHKNTNIPLVLSTGILLVTSCQKPVFVLQAIPCKNINQIYKIL